MDITRNDDGSLNVPVEPDRQDIEAAAADGTEAAPTTITLHPGEGGYDAALADWDRQQNPDAEPAVSTASGREEAMAVVAQVADDPKADLGDVVDHLDDPEASADALRHVLVGGVHSVEDFAQDVADTEGVDVIPTHQVQKIIGEVLAEIDS